MKKLEQFFLMKTPINKTISAVINPGTNEDFASNCVGHIIPQIKNPRLTKNPEKIISAIELCIETIKRKQKNKIIY